MAAPLILPARSAPARDRAAALLLAGEVVAVPTDTVYGIAAAVSVPGATAGLFAAKSRPAEVALPVLVAATGQALELMARPTPALSRLLERWWPGPLTVVVRRSGASRAYELGGERSTIGLRCPDSELVRDLVGRAGPLATTSANRHRQPTPATAEAVAEALGAAVSLVLDGGACEGAASTLVDVTGTEPRLLREGGVAWQDVLSVLAG